MTKRFFIFAKGSKEYELRENVGGEFLLASRSRGVIAQYNRLSVLLMSILTVGKMISDSIAVVFSPPPTLVEMEGHRPLNDEERQEAENTLVAL